MASGEADPPVSITEPSWIRDKNVTYFVHQPSVVKMMRMELSNAEKKSAANWAKLHGADRTKWPFNTVCCDTKQFRDMATCDKVG